LVAPRPAADLGRRRQPRRPRRAADRHRAAARRHRPRDRGPAGRRERGPPARGLSRLPCGKLCPPLAGLPHHRDVPLRLDPRLPLVWRSPDSLQIGVDRAIVVLESVTNAEERMLAALVGGTTDAALALLAETAGATPDETAALLRRVAPALVPA